MRDRTISAYRGWAVLLLGGLLAACNMPRAQALAGQPPTPSLAAPTLTPTATPVPLTYWTQAGVPADLAASARKALEGAGFSAASSAEGTQVQIVLNPPPDARLVVQRVYAVVVPFPTVADDISLADLKILWQGGANTPANFDSSPRVFATADVSATLEPLLGKAGAELVQTDEAGLVDAAWNARPSLAIVPFDQLQPRWKVLSVDGKSPLDKTLDLSGYPLVVKIGAVATSDAGQPGLSAISASGGWQATNRDTSKMVTLVMTGTTALTRATGWFMDHHGVNFPAQNIMPFLADADILHVSNEVSFTPKCPPAQLTGDEKFCSSPTYFGLLKTIGVDVVELTGNHNNDYGTAPDDYSLDLYDQANIPHFGGGRNTQDAETPRILTAPDGTKIGFVGCNTVGPFPAWATDKTPGAANCGDWAWIKAVIADLKSSHKADIVVTTLQYHELPQYDPSAQQRADFESLAAAGADIVSGSQAHQPQGFSFASGKVIHFGVGNLFFDQMDYVQNRQMFADKYILYQGKVISLILFTGMNENWSQPRPMTSEERAAFLKIIFGASGW